jgi:hypothetical protein
VIRATGEQAPFRAFVVAAIRSTVVTLPHQSNPPQLTVEAATSPRPKGSGTRQVFGLIRRQEPLGHHDGGRGS